MRRVCLATIVLLLTSLSQLQAQTDVANDDGKLHIICFGAHPDDAEYRNGGCAALWAKQGHHVKLVSVTNGDIGHWQMAGGPLAMRRTAESALVAERLGATSQVLDIHDGELMPTLENRRIITRLIRDWKADVVSPIVRGTITRITDTSACLCKTPRSWSRFPSFVRTRRLSRGTPYSCIRATAF